MIRRRALPDDLDGPPEIPKLPDLASVPPCCLEKLGAPEFSVALRQAGPSSSLVAMPEAPVDQNCHSLGTNHDVRSPWQAEEVSVVFDSKRVENSHRNEFWSRSRCSDTLHSLGSGRIRSEVPRVVRRFHCGEISVE